MKRQNGPLPGLNVQLLGLFLLLLCLVFQYNLAISLAPSHQLPRIAGNYWNYAAGQDTFTIDPKNLIKYPRSSFEFRLSEDDRDMVFGPDVSGIKIDTFHGTVTIKDLRSRIVLGERSLRAEPHLYTKTINLVLSDEELDQIYRKAQEIRLFEMPEPSPQLLPRMNICSLFSFSNIIRLNVKAGDVVKSFEWCCGNTPAPDAEVQWKGMGEFLGLIYATVTRRPEYEALLKTMSRI